MARTYDSWNELNADFERGFDIDTADLVCPNKRCPCGINIEVLQLPNPRGWWSRSGQARCLDCGTRFQIAGSDNSLEDGFRATQKKDYPTYFRKKYPACKGQVEFLGFVDESRLQDLYRNCDVFVAPSHYESFGLIYLEAMNYARPVIGCSSGGPEDIIVDGGQLLTTVLTKPIIVHPSPAMLKEAEGAKRYDRRMTASPLIDHYWKTVTSRKWFDSDRVVKAYDLESGKELWKVASKVMPLSLCVDSANAYIHNGVCVVAIDRK